MSQSETAKIGQASEPGEYDEGMLALLQIMWGDGFLSPGGADELARVLEPLKGPQAGNTIEARPLLLL
jgi:hypothetical protein